MISLKWFSGGLLAFALVSFTSQAEAAGPQEPGWTHGVFLFGEAKAKKDATPILMREYRPLHFYGNTVRRQYYRDTVRPSAGDALQASKAIIVRD